MAEQNNQQEKTEQPTPKKIDDARKKGQVAKSMELNTAMILLFAFIFMYFTGGALFDKMAYLSKVVFQNVGSTNITADNLTSYTVNALISGAKIAAPLVLFILFIGLVAGFSQVGFMLSFEPLIPKFEKISPASGFKRMFSRRSLIELAKGILKIVIVGGIAYVDVKAKITEFIQLSDMEPLSIIRFGGQAAFVLGVKIALVLFILAMFDFIFQKWDHTKKLMMSKQEVKDEMKQMEGDPLIKARIKAIQRENSRRRMMDEVPTADVVITNPTRLAIAIKYDQQTSDAPIVVAKGARKMAEKIRNIAKENNVPIVEDKPLAQALFKAVEVGGEVPETFFQAVAEILAYVYKLKNKRVA